MLANRPKRTDKVAIGLLFDGDRTEVNVAEERQEDPSTLPIKLLLPHLHQDHIEDADEGLLRIDIFLLDFWWLLLAKLIRERVDVTSDDPWRRIIDRVVIKFGLRNA